ncbi:hypothetical protein [Luminiphilus syltensis]|uniref:hypothetical protein n=1 Tax=Luminiphilus syltensis TaxID=1341119 RepID=UPI00058EDA7C|nr:hypothetical protein [Luminiphilus syltensis]
MTTTNRNTLRSAACFTLLASCIATTTFAASENGKQKGADNGQPFVDLTALMQAEIDLGCTTDQIIRWDDTGGTWVCATDPFVGLSCNDGDALRFSSTNGWQCTAQPITASLVDTFVDFSSGGGVYLSDRFESFTNVRPDTICDAFPCDIVVLGVADHSSCVVEITGNSRASRLNIDTSVGRITLFYMDDLAFGEPLFINISCAT